MEAMGWWDRARADPFLAANQITAGTRANNDNPYIVNSGTKISPGAQTN